MKILKMSPLIREDERMAKYGWKTMVAHLGLLRTSGLLVARQRQWLWVEEFAELVSGVVGVCHRW